MQTKTIKVAKENEAAQEETELGLFSCKMKTKKVVLWDQGKEKHKESEKSTEIILMPTLKYA